MEQLDVVSGRREDDGLLLGAVHHLVVSVMVRIMVRIMAHIHGTYYTLYP